MSSPKNFHNAVDIEKLGINEIPKIKNDLDALETRVDNLPVLPGVTSADEGKTLMVDSTGDWTVKNEVVIVKCTYSSSNKTITLLDDMTAKDVIDLALSNNYVVLNTSTSTYPKSAIMWHMVNRIQGINDRANSVIFQRIFTSGIGEIQNFELRSVKFDGQSPNATSISVDHIKVNDYNLLLPETYYEDEGKVLTVAQDGEGWTLTTPSNLPAVTSDDNGNLLEVVNGAWSKSNDISDKVQFIYDYLNLSGEELVHSYDFTVDGNDLVSTDPVNLTSESATTFSAGGLQVSANDHMQLRGLGAVCGFNRRLVFEMGVNNITGAGNLLSVYNGNSIKWTGTEWTINGNSTGITNPNYFYNKVLQIKIGASYDDVKIMTQDGVIYEGSFNPAGDFGGLMIGGFTPNGGSCYSFYVKTLKVYASF